MALKMLYPAVHEDQRYSVGDMDRLVGERIKNPEQAADTPYGVASVFEAASFFLAGTPTTTIMEAKAETPEGKVKVEEYTSLVDIITKAVSQSLAPTLAAMAQGSTMAAQPYKDVKTVGAPRDIFQLDVNERIESLEKKLFALRKHPTFDGIQVPPHPDKGKAPALPINATPSAPAVPGKTTVPAPGPSTPSKRHDLPPHMPNAPIHLYTQACDINRPRQPAPKTVRFDMSQEKVAEAEQARSKEPAYHAQKKT
ncbi:hypothetical protein NEOLEDRAFT_1183929 [Neolentinus lepideus HHB14362 ss-1]|uniref:Uncharacterized protein n=1 Tax=Neolentinus lepideus HHB14362 ss-1 TaxID=1314782 RepID=A0A165MWD2_9AGAM|nr:hypothetical protein NEOLEDRAFT_1183929 [Neolentinus lepideus HHB14362 ss-1]